MLISDFAIRKPIVTTVVMLALVAFGIAALLRLDTDEFPEITPPIVSIAIPYPGAAPGVVEREVVDPIEEAVQSIAGVDRIRATALDGYAVLVVEFVFEKDPIQATQDVRDQIAAIRGDLPPEMEEPILTRFDPQDLPIVSLALSSTTQSPAALTQLADPTIRRALTAIPGVADVTVIGGVERELTVELRPGALEAAGVSLGDVVRVLGAENLAAPVGQLRLGATERTLRLAGRPADPAAFAQLVVSSAGGRVVRLGELATVRDGTEEPRSAALFEGRPAVGIDVKMATGYSTTDVADAVRARVTELAASLPAGTRLDIVRDAGVRVGQSVRDVQRTLLEGAALTILVVFVFLRSWRSTVITGLALPVSVIASFVAVWAFGFTLNTMSLLGLSLAIGILVDDAIVVRENIVRHLEGGRDHVVAAREGTSEIGLAVTATTLSIVVVFVPIAFMGGIAEQWFAPFALTIACSVLVSLFVSFSLDPMLSAVWEDPEALGQRTWLSRKLEGFDRALERLTARYRRVIAWTLRHRAITVAIAVATFVGALALPATGLVGSAFFPETDRSEIQLAVELPAGTSLDASRRKVAEIAELARRHPEVAYVYATIGGETGAVDEAALYLRLVPKAERESSQADVTRRLRQELAALGGVTAYVPSGFGDEKQVQIQLTGPDLAALDRIARDAADRIRGIPGVVDVGLSSKGQRPELAIVPDRDAAGVLGVSVADLAQALRAGFAGVDVGDWIDPTGETRDVTVRLDPGARERPEDLAGLPVRGSGGTGAAVPLAQVARIEPGLAPAQIEHLDGERVVTVGANTEGRPLSAIQADIERALADLALPPGYRRLAGGESEDQAEVFGRMLAALGIAILLMYLVLVVQFGSFVDPLPIMASLPLSLIGVMLAMLVTGSTLNLMSMIGVILLMGLVAKNAILLVDFAKRVAATGRSREEALVEAGAVRFRPILMTSVAVIAGMVPVALGHGEGGDFRAPLGRAVIGGVITSTVLTLLAIPTFYDLTANARDRLLARLRRRRRRRAAGPGAPHPRA